MDDAPMPRTEKGKPDTTGRHVLQVLGEHARADGSNAHPSVLRIQYRTGYDRTTVQRALRRLEKAGLIWRDGTVDGRTRWHLAMHLVRPESDWAELEREESEFRAAAAERKRRSRAKGVTGAESVTVTDSKCVTVTDAESVTGDVTDFTPSRHALNAWPSRTQRRPNHQQPSVNQLHKDSSSPPAQTDAAPARASEPSKPDTESVKDEQQQQPDPRLEAFGAFWLVYPKKKAREEAKKAFLAALNRGADPQHIVDAATGYARERAGEEPKYTKYPATWLNKGCYDDEPDPVGRPNLRAVGGRHTPHRDHEDQSIYLEGWGN
ncbi:helix-turn-helix domain-containing protein [Streptomyces sp. NRRL F-5135]|uniref:helix-turn-helix domain-containing protein n=1 Tax=Streptomyces sp. NRRL F-5135 TaxID=1463858 RepID=UPI00131DD81A|nr:helix-turn-helix domain-containing protein [Streptomyces sp. NRRL F-5135]